MRRRIFLALVCLSLALVACTSLLGAPDIFYQADASQGGGGDGGAPDVTAGGDGGPQGDASRDGPIGSEGGNEGGNCGDTTASAANCGACGHDCLGGTCVGSKCQPVTVAAVPGETYALAVDDTSLYFSEVGGTDAGTLYSVPKNSDHGTPTVVLRTKDPLLYDLLLDPTGLYFSSGSVSFSQGKGLVETCAPDGGARRVIASAQVPRGLSMDSQKVYWQEYAASPQAVQGAPKSGTNLDGGTTLAATENGADMVLADNSSQYLFWTIAAADGVIRRCTLPICAGLGDYVTDLTSPSAIGQNQTLLFYASGAQLLQLAKSAGGGPGAVFANNQGQPLSIVADDKDVYWVNTGTYPSFADGSVRHCPIVGGIVTCQNDGDVLATSGKNPRVIVMDAKAIYWTVQYDGAVYRLAR